MKSSSKIPTPLAGAIVLGILASFTPVASAANQIWYGSDAILGGTGTWSAGGVGWDGIPNGSGTWTDGNTAQFTAFQTGQTPGVVTIGSNLTISALEFSGAGTAYTFDNTATGYSIDITGAGISSSGGAGPQLFVNTNAGTVTFSNSATAGDSTITLTGAAGSLIFNDSASAGSAVINSQSGDTSFNGTSSLGTSTINNSGPSVLNIWDNATATGATIANGGTLDLTFHNGPLTVATLANSFGGAGGDIVLGSNTLNIGGGLTLGNTSGQKIGYEMVGTGGNTGRITLLGGSSFTAPTSGQITIQIDDLDGFNATPGTTYTLIDWTLAASTSNLDIGDFLLSNGAPNLAGSYLEFQGTTLVLVAVPEPATLAMPMMGVLGMMWLRRRTARNAS